MTGRSERIVLAFVLLFAGVVAAAPAAPLDGKPRVIDGDTIELAGHPVRLHGIGAPRQGWGCAIDGQPRDCRLEATFALARMIEDHWVSCTIVGVDTSGEMLGICRTIGGKELNRAMVAEGWARAFTQYTSEYVPEEIAARSAGLGIWFEPLPDEAEGNLPDR